MQRRVSMADVAVLAGVSGQTVSRVVNDSPRVDPETRRRVEEAMAQLDYRPHRAARALRTGRTDTIGLIVATLATVGNSRMLQAIADAAADRGLALTVVTAVGREAVARGFQRLRDQGVDGAIVLNEATALARDVEIPAGLALVVVDSPEVDAVGTSRPTTVAAARARGYGTVQTDHAAGARAAVEHLIARGRTRIWHLAGPAGSYPAIARERGWRDALAAAGLSVPEGVEGVDGGILRGDWTAASGSRLGAELPADADAVFAANDQMALGLLRALGEAGRRVPEEVAVVGFDDLTDAADYRPPLTTMHQDFDGLGTAAVASLVTAIEGSAPAPVVLVPELVVRASS